jgi:hypothetical protein
LSQIGASKDHLDSNQAQLSHTLVRQFGSNWFDTPDQTLKASVAQSNPLTFSAYSEMRVHPPLTSTINCASIRLSGDSELSDLVNSLDPKALDPLNLFKNLPQMPSHPELLASVNAYRRRFHEFISTISGVVQGRCLDGRMRGALISARNELQGQMINLRRMLKQREAADDGWEYVDQ